MCENISDKVPKKTFKKKTQSLSLQLKLLALNQQQNISDKVPKKKHLKKIIILLSPSLQLKFLALNTLQNISDKGVQRVVQSIR
jgi:hypothetical protein